jgi:hypothetical protein
MTAAAFSVRAAFDVGTRYFGPLLGRLGLVSRSSSSSVTISDNFAPGQLLKRRGVAHLVEALVENQVGDLLDDLEGIGEAARPEIVPDAIDLAAQFTCKHSSLRIAVAVRAIAVLRLALSAQSADRAMADIV